MTRNTSFYRKVAFGAAIAALLYPLSWLSSPATVSPLGVNPGGKLAQLRDKYRLGQGNLGEIDPASETMKLATLGLRGLAMNLLWQKANYYKKTEDWSNLTATLDQLSKLQPNFITFWKFQSWNISYNLSVEFDDYHDRYYYVRRGIEFLKKGESYNKDNPHLLWDLGWTIGQKIGRADEYIQYRRLFKADEDFHPADRLPKDRDNWLVGKEWYLKAIDAVENKGRNYGKKSPKVFYSGPAMSQMNYAEAIGKEGFFDAAVRAWKKAAQEWDKFGDLTIEHSTGVKLHLNDVPKLEAEVTELQSELDQLIPGTREKLAESKRAALTEEVRKALETPPDERTSKQEELAYTAAFKLVVTPRDIADRIAEEDPEAGKAALKLAATLKRVLRQLQYTENYRKDSNYAYWKLRTEFEQTPAASHAHKMMYQGRKAFEDEADLLKSQELYQEGFASWRKVLDQFPELLDPDGTTGDDLMEYIKEYRKILDQLDETLDDDFPLWAIVENFDSERAFVEELRQHKSQQEVEELQNSTTTSEGKGEAGSAEENAGENDGKSSDQ